MLRAHTPHTSCAWLCERWVACRASGPSASEPGPRPAAWAPWRRRSPWARDSGLSGPASERTGEEKTWRFRTQSSVD